MPTKPYMLVCIDTESLAIMGNELLRDPPSPQDLLSLIIASMEKPCVGRGVPVLPEKVQLEDSAVFELIESKLGPLGVKAELVRKFSSLPEFKKIMEREQFSKQPGYSGREN